MSVVVRTACAGDVPAIETMHAACSLDSRVARWQAPVRSVPSRYLADAVSERFGHVALVATEGDEVIGLVSAVHVSAGAWDLGVLVRDDRQRRGLGTRLIAEAVAEATRRGATGLRADLTPSRRFLLELLRPLGRVLARIDGDGVHVRVNLADRPVAIHTNSAEKL